MHRRCPLLSYIYGSTVRLPLPHSTSDPPLIILTHDTAPPPLLSRWRVGRGAACPAARG